MSRQPSLIGKPYRQARVSEVAAWASREDMKRLQQLGFVVLDLDFPPEVKLTDKQREALVEHWKLTGQPRYRPDFVVIHPWLTIAGKPLWFFWETKSRDVDVENAYDLGYWVIPETQFRMLRVWRQKFNQPVYLSLWFQKEWLGYADVSEFEILQTIRSQKHGEAFLHLPVWPLKTDLERLLQLRQPPKPATKTSSSLSLAEIM